MVIILQVLNEISKSLSSTDNYKETKNINPEKEEEKQKSELPDKSDEPGIETISRKKIKKK